MKKQLARERARLAMANDKANVEAFKAKALKSNTSCGGGGGRRGGRRRGVVTTKTKIQSKNTKKLSKKEARERAVLAMAEDKANVESVLAKTNGEVDVVHVVAVVPNPKLGQSAHLVPPPKIVQAVPETKEGNKQPAADVWFWTLLLDVFLGAIKLAAVLIWSTCIILLPIGNWDFRSQSDLALFKGLVLTFLLCSIFLLRKYLWRKVKVPAKRFVVGMWKWTLRIVVVVVSVIVFVIACFGLIICSVVLYYIVECLFDIMYEL